MKETFMILNDDAEETSSKIDLYIRISYFGKSITTEIMIPESVRKAFYAQEETNEMYPYQCRELEPEELEGGCWGSLSFIPPTKPQNCKCDCQNENSKELFKGKEKDKDSTKDVDKGTEKDKSKKKEPGKGKGKDKEKVWL